MPKPLTVAQTINVLQDFEPDMPLRVYSDGREVSIYEDSFEKITFGQPPRIVLDIDAYADEEEEETQL